MKKNESYLRIASTRGIEIEMDDIIVALPNEKYLERHLLYHPEKGDFYIAYSVYDNQIEYCYHSDIKKKKDITAAEKAYYQSFNDVRGLKFEINPDSYIEI
jgi:hypothetical protein